MAKTDGNDPLMRDIKVSSSGGRQEYEGFADAGPMQFYGFPRGGWPAVAGRPSGFPFCRAWANPALVRSRRTSRSKLREDGEQPGPSRDGIKPGSVLARNLRVEEMWGKSETSAQNVRWRPPAP